MGMDPSSHQDILQGIFLGELWNSRGKMKGRTEIKSQPKFPAFIPAGDLGILMLECHQDTWRAHTQINSGISPNNPTHPEGLHWELELRPARVGEMLQLCKIPSYSQIFWSSRMSHQGIWQLLLFLRELQLTSLKRRKGKLGKIFPQNTKKVENSLRRRNSCMVFTGICVSVPCGKLEARGNIFRIFGRGFGHKLGFSAGHSHF